MCRMRRLVFIAALLLVTTIPVCAQRRGFSGPGMGRGFSAPRMSGAAAMRPSGRIIIRGGFGVNNPRSSVFFGFGPRRFHHRFRPFFNPFFSPFGFGGFGFGGFPAYPYYPYGLQSDFVYSNAATQPASDYNASQDAALASEVYRLRAEVDLLREQQALHAEQQQYAANSPREPSRTAAPNRPTQEAPPTVLVYRDGHRVEVKNYAVVGPTLWIFSEERARKVPLADIDVDATRRANEERGVEFNVHQAARPTGEVLPENAPSPPQDSRPQAAPTHTARANELPLPE